MIVEGEALYSWFGVMIEALFVRRRLEAVGGLRGGAHEMY